MNKKPPHKLRFAVLATDVVLFTVFDTIPHVLLIRVHRPPHFVHRWGLPGGLIHPGETADEAAVRHLGAKGNVKNTRLEQLYTFSGVHRDPRGRVVSVAYVGLVPESKVSRFEKTPDVRWCPVYALPKLAYDHTTIVGEALRHVRVKLEHTNIVCNLLPNEFSLSEIQHMYEIFLRKKLDKRNFRKKILSLHVLKKVGKQKRGSAHRPAELYRCKTLTPQDIEIL